MNRPNPTPSSLPQIKIIRSNRRRKTIQARRIGDYVEIRAPAGMSDHELAPHIERLTAQLARKAVGRELDDAELAAQAQRLNQAHFDGALTWQSIRWVTNQQGRFGSCTPANRSIRISHRLATMPAFVLEYVLVHELAHLIEANHGPRFWALVNRYPLTERARGYLLAVGLEGEDGTCQD